MKRDLLQGKYIFIRLTGFVRFDYAGVVFSSG